MSVSEDKKTIPWRSLLVLEGITLGAGALNALLTRGSMQVYQGLVKPSFAPSGWVFPVAWTILYAMMAAGAWYVWREKRPGWKTALVLYALQLAVNLAWPWVFFVMQAYGLAFVVLSLLWGLVIYALLLFACQSRTAGWLMVPYLLWTTFAGALNFAIARLN